ncbi:MAG: alkaline phosphatase [bacterium]|nr:alkaline phosphatase [bacterium]
MLMTLGLSLAALFAQDPAPGPHQANGIKIGEVDATRAVVWVRATRAPEARADGPEFSRKLKGVRVDPFEGLGEGIALDDVRFSVPGAPAEMSVSWWPAKTRQEPRTTPWKAVAAESDFTHQFELGVEAGTEYRVRVDARAPGTKAIASTTLGRFRTAPAGDVVDEVAFTVVTGQGFHRRDDRENGHKIYAAMLELAPSFFVHTGDIVYYDKPGPFAGKVELARHKWNRMYALPYQRAFHTATASYFLKDDHDTLKNDCWPGQKYGELTWEDGLRLFREQVPAPRTPYRTVRWGRDLQIWLLEGRDFRSSNQIRDGVGKTILGKAQLAWLKETLEASDATFRIVISPTPIVGPDRKSKNDNHANDGFATEGEALRHDLASLERVFTICGDRHWQYHSVDPKTGLQEFSCGPTSDAHAGGFKNEPRDMHRYLRVKGGFLSVTVGRDDEGPRAMLRHHDVLGGVQHEVEMR